MKKENTTCCEKCKGNTNKLFPTKWCTNYECSCHQEDKAEGWESLKGWDRIWTLVAPENRKVIDYVIEDLLANQKQAIMKELIKWIFKNHDHHDDERICEDKGFPYVNSKDLEKFIKKLLKKLNN